jgi:putative ABC transport system permease protein
VTSFVLTFGEWPWILAISIATYLSFERWRFPDLTIEGAFSAGMASSYFAAVSGDHPPGRFFLLLIAALAIPAILATACWTLARLRFPSLLAGLVVMLSAYSMNFVLNGNSVSQQLPINAYFRSNEAMARFEAGFGVALALSLLLAVVALLLDRSRLGNRLLLARQTRNPDVVTALGINAPLTLLMGMIVYNGVAFLGGVAFAFQEQVTGLSFIGAISTGLASTFLLRSLVSIASAPSRRPLLPSVDRLLRFFLGLPNSLLPVMVALVILSGLTTFVRVSAREYASLGMLNALTAAGTITLWLVVSALGSALGKRVSGFDDAG